MERFGRYVNRELGRPSNYSWVQTLLEEYGEHTPAIECAEKIANLYEKWLEYSD